MKFSIAKFVQANYFIKVVKKVQFESRRQSKLQPAAS